MKRYGKRPERFWCAGWLTGWLTAAWIAAAAAAWVGGTQEALAQQSGITVPGQGVSSGFYERFGVGLSGGGPGWFFNQGGFDSALPPFGGYDPNSGLRFGTSVPFGGGRLSFRFEASSGSSRTMNMGAPMLTLPNGVPGAFGNISQVPFVTGIIPVVGADPVSPFDLVGRWKAGERPMPSAGDQTETSGSSIEASATSPTQDSLLRLPDTSSAAAGVRSLAKIRQELSAEDARKQAEREAESQRLLQLAVEAERQGKTAVARMLRHQASKLLDPQ